MRVQYGVSSDTYERINQSTPTQNAPHPATIPRRSIEGHLAGPKSHLPDIEGANS